MSPTSYRTAPPRDDINVIMLNLLQYAVHCFFLYKIKLRCVSVETTRCWFLEVTLVAPPRDNLNVRYCVTHYRKMEEEEGFEPPRATKPLSVFKTDPFSQTWVFLRYAYGGPCRTRTCDRTVMSRQL